MEIDEDQERLLWESCGLKPPDDLLWRRFTLRDNPISRPEWGEDSMQVNWEPNHVWDKIHEFTYSRNQKREKYLCIGFILGQVTSEKERINVDKWDTWSTINDDTLKITWEDVNDAMWRFMSGSANPITHVYFGYENEEIKMMRLRYYECCTYPDTPDYTREIVLTKWDLTTKYDEGYYRVIVMNPEINRPVSDLPNVPDQSRFDGISYMMPYENE